MRLVIASLRAWLAWRRQRPTPERSGDRFAGDLSLWLLRRPEMNDVSTRERTRT